MSTKNIASTRQEKYESYKKQWSAKKRGAIEKELGSMRKWLERNRDTFFQESAPDELTDGLRVIALSELLSEIDASALAKAGAA